MRLFAQFSQVLAKAYCAVVIKLGRYYAAQWCADSDEHTDDGCNRHIEVGGGDGGGRPALYSLLHRQALLLHRLNFQRR